MLSKRIFNSLISSGQFRAQNCKFSFAKKKDTEKAKQGQEEAYDTEKCILVDENDKALGWASKRDCHRVQSPTQWNLKLHRAFSVFMFNGKGDLVLQKRSDHKITFPGLYTNICCSHPLYEIEGEREEKDALGVKRAAQRRLNYELGIPLDQIQPQDFHYMTRIHYELPGDFVWGEQEIDYLLILHKDVDMEPHPDEVSDIKYIKRENLDEQFSALDAPLTPWFKMILKFRLKQWWDHLDNLKKFQEHDKITRF